MAYILIVEDEELIARSSSAYLATRGHETLVAPTLAAARKVLRQGDVDLMVLDVVLPDGNGLDLLAEKDVALPVIVMTGHILSELDPEVRRFGVVAVLDKPFRNEELARQVKAALGTIPDREGEAEQPGNT